MSGLRVGVCSLLLVLPAVANAQESDHSLAKQLANPISSLISVPIQYNYDCCYGERDGNRSTLNIQPVIPTGISPNWNLITRTIVPVVGFTSPALGVDGEFGLSDTVQSFFFSPKATHNGVTWGAGPVFLWPTATDRDLGADKWGAGPTFVILKQQSGWTRGRAHQSHLVLRRCGRRQSQARSERHLHPAVPVLHLEGFDHAHPQLGVHL